MSVPRDNIIVDVQDVRREFHVGGEVVHALAGVSLQIREGEYVSIMGPSGSGKSTLFNMVGGLDQPTAGRVSVHGLEITSLPSRKAAWLRCRSWRTASPRGPSRLPPAASVSPAAPWGRRVRR